MNDKKLILLIKSKIIMHFKNHIKNSFNKSATTYDSVAHLQRETNDYLLKKLTLINPMISNIIDLGSGTGYALSQLQKLAPHSKPIGIDIAHNMLKKSPKKFSKQLICGDIENLPLQKNSFDLVFSNLSLQWCIDLEKAFCNIQNILTHNGLFIFSTLGPKTFYELQQCWHSTNENLFTENYFDEKKLQQKLITAAFKGTHIETHKKRYYYSRVTDLIQELKLLGARNLYRCQNKGLIGKQRWQCFIKHYENFRQNNLLPVTYEIIYGFVKK